MVNPFLHVNAHSEWTTADPLRFLATWDRHVFLSIHLAGGVVLAEEASTDVLHLKDGSAVGQPTRSFRGGVDAWNQARAIFFLARRALLVRKGLGLDECPFPATFRLRLE